MHTDSVISRYLKGDEEAFRELLEPQTPALRARIGRQMAPLLRRKVSIQDVLQEVSIVAFERRDAFTGCTREDFHRWIGVIADRSTQAQVNHHAGTLKRDLNAEISRPGRGDTANVLGRGASPSQHVIGSETEYQAERALEQLSDDHREVLRLYREEGLSLGEVAVRMGRSREAAKKLHGRAMVQFIKHFENLRGREDD